MRHSAIRQAASPQPQPINVLVCCVPWLALAKAHSERPRAPYRRRAYLKHVMMENQQLEAERGAMRQYERDYDRYESLAAAEEGGVAGKFFNKDQDRRVPAGDV